MAGQCGRQPRSELEWSRRRQESGRKGGEGTEARASVPKVLRGSDGAASEAR